MHDPGVVAAVSDGDGGVGEAAAAGQDCSPGAADAAAGTLELIVLTRVYRTRPACCALLYIARLLSILYRPGPCAHQIGR